MADGGAGRELRARASLVTVAFTRHILTTLPSEGVMSWSVVSWTGKSDVYQQPLADLHGHCNNHIVTSCVFCASRPNLYHKTTAASTVLDARGGLVLGVGGAQEEQGWRRRAL